MTDFETFISVLSGIGFILTLFCFINYLIAKKQGDPAKQPFYLRLGVLAIVVTFVGTISAPIVMNLITNV